MKSRTFYSAIAIIASVLLVIGIAGFWGLTAQNPRSLISKGGQAEPVAAQFVPRQAPLMASVLARPDRLWQLRQLLTPARERAAARQEWQSLKQTLVDTLGWDYDTDVRPWLDQEVTVAVTTPDIDHDSSNGLQTGYLIMLGCQDAPQAKEALHVLWQKRTVSGRNLVFETISGVSLIYDQLPTDPAFRSLSALAPEKLAIDTLATAVVGDRQVLLANHPQVIRQAIATYQAPDVSLARSPHYRESIRTLPKNRIGWLYANIPPLLTWLGLEEAVPSNEPVSITPSGRRAQALFLSLRARSGSLLGDTAITPAPGTSFSQSASSAPAAPNALNLLPRETLFAIAGQNLAQFLANLNENISGYRLAQRSLQSLSDAVSLPDVTLSPSLLDTFDQEYALGFIGNSTPAWLLIAKANGNNTFSPLDSLAQDQGITVSHVDLGGQDVTTWTRLSLIRTGPQRAINLATQVMGVHTTINGYEVFSNALTGLERVLQQDEPTLPQEPEFVQLTQNLSKPGSTLAYINWPNLAPTLLRRFLWLRVVEDAGQPLTGHLGPLVIQGYDSQPSRQEGILAIKLRENP
jgi:hypothetical protein